MPSLFPFKRQEENSNTGEKAQNTPTVNSTSTSTSKKDSSNPSKTSTTRRPSAWRRLRRRKDKRKDHDRQMISINGKQYYVNDEGELKDWNDQSDT